MTRLHYLLLKVLAVLLLCSCLSVLAGPAHAQDQLPDEKLSQWNALSEQERDQLRGSLNAWKQMSQEDRQRVLENFKKFKALSSQDQSRVIENYNRYMSMDALQRKVVRERYKKWKQMSPAQRDLLTSRYQTLMKMRPEDQAQFFENYQAWQRLTAQQQEQLLSQWNMLTEAEKQLLRLQQGSKTTQEQREAIKNVLQKLRQNWQNRVRNRSGKSGKNTNVEPPSL